MPVSNIYNMDCMEYMRTVPDKWFDLAVVDPPYGDGNAAIGGGNASEGYSTVTKSVKRIGGRFGKYGKKYLAGMKPPGKNISMNCSGFQSSR